MPKKLALEDGLTGSGEEGLTEPKPKKARVAAKSKAKAKADAKQKKEPKALRPSKFEPHPR